jgi:predicted aspartyl protease
MRCIPIRIEAIGLIVRMGLTLPKSEGGKDSIHWIDALVDTGATHTSVSLEIAVAVTLPNVGEDEMVTPAGRVTIELFHGDVVLDPNAPRFFRDRRLAGLIHRQPEFDAVLGMDLLEKGVLTFDGPAKMATFCW